MIKSETLETKKVNSKVYWVYAKAVGLLVALTIFLLMIVNQGFTLGMVQKYVRVKMIIFMK